MSRPNFVSKRCWRFVLLAAAFSAITACGNSSSSDDDDGTPVGPLIMQIDWTPANPPDNNLDIGATTPNGFIAAGFVTDSRCLHNGDEGFAGGAGPFQERMRCDSPFPGSYTVVVENYTNDPQTFLLSVTINGINVQDTTGAQLTGMHMLPANTNTRFGTEDCLDGADMPVDDCNFDFEL